MADIFNVRLSKSAKKDLKKVPQHIGGKLEEWIDQVGLYGLRIVRQRPGCHDEPLLGQRWAQRSIRLSRSYRAIYVEKKDGSIELVEVLEVNKHAY